MWIDDQVIKQCDQKLVCHSWVPSGNMVVLGRSNKEEQEVNSANCRADDVPVLKRYGGGGTVLLGPSCVVVSVGAWVESQYDNDKYFCALNKSLIDCFSRRFPEQEFVQRGYSDIVMGNKKFVGTSLFRSRQYLLYQASILVNLDLLGINRYLKYPSKEPDYRKGRSHDEFLTSLSQLDRNYSAMDCLEDIQGTLDNTLYQRLADDLCAPQEEHFRHLWKRAGLS